MGTTILRWDMNWLKNSKWPTPLKVVSYHNQHRLYGLGYPRLASPELPWESEFSLVFLNSFTNRLHKYRKSTRSGNTPRGKGGVGWVASMVTLAGGTSFSHKTFLKFGQSHFLKIYWNQNRKSPRSSRRKTRPTISPPCLESDPNRNVDGQDLMDRLVSALMMRRVMRSNDAQCGSMKSSWHPEHSVKLVVSSIPRFWETFCLIETIFSFQRAPFKRSIFFTDISFRGFDLTTIQSKTFPFKLLTHFLPCNLNFTVARLVGTPIICRHKTRPWDFASSFDSFLACRTSSFTYTVKWPFARETTFRHPALLGAVGESEKWSRDTAHIKEKRILQLDHSQYGLSGWNLTKRPAWQSQMVRESLVFDVFLLLFAIKCNLVRKLKQTYSMCFLD